MSFSVFRCPGCEEFVIEDLWSHVDDICRMCADEVYNAQCEWCKHIKCSCDADYKEYREERDYINSLELDRDID